MPDKILVDTSPWIEFFKKKESPVSLNLTEFTKLNFATMFPLTYVLYRLQ
jgi:hypothetical protein